MIVDKQAFTLDETDIVCKIEVILESGFRNVLYFEEDVDIEEDAVAASLIEWSEDRERMWTANGRWDPVKKEVIKHNAKW